MISSKKIVKKEKDDEYDQKSEFSSTDWKELYERNQVT